MYHTHPALANDAAAGKPWRLHPGGPHRRAHHRSPASRNGRP
jgi:hypothetical protein